MKLETLMSIKERRSVRSYRKEQISKEELDAVLEAGTYAASGMGRQPAKMVVVQEPELIAKLSKMNGAVMGADSDPFYGAPTVVIVFADTYAGVACCILGYADGPLPEAKPRKNDYIVRV